MSNNNESFSRPPESLEAITGAAHNKLTNLNYQILRDSDFEAISKLNIDIGKFNISASGVSIEGVPGNFNPKKKGVEWSLALGEKNIPQTRKDKAQEKQRQANMEALYEAAVAQATIGWEEGQLIKKQRVEDVTLRPDEYRDIHGEDPFTGETVS